ncbi:MAG: hypothetical protein U1E21_08420 [Reyranellaceae bacterium]|jgi:hypothetical protein
MLTDDELKRIAAEEHYRQTIRKSLEAETAALAAPPPASPPEHHGFGKKLFDFLNSSVGMWLLSSVVLTGGAAVIQQIQHDHEARLQNHQALSAHRFEIHHRLDNMTFLLRRAKTVGDAKAALDGIFKSTIPLSPELQNRSLGSLYMGLMPLLAGSEKQKASEAFTLVRQLEEAELVMQSQPDDHPLDQSQRNRLTKLVNTIQKLHFKEIE